MTAMHEFQTKEQYEQYLRTYFAAMAMQGLLAGKYESHTIDYDIECSIKAADALIKALNND